MPDLSRREDVTFEKFDPEPGTDFYRILEEEVSSGLSQAEAGEFASEAEVEAAYAAFK